MPRMLITDALEKYSRAKQLRAPHDNQFRMNAAYCMPRDYLRWTSSEMPKPGTNMNSGDAQARFAFDNTGVRCIPKYVAICKRLINPDNIKYHVVKADNDDLNRIPAVRTFFDELTDKLFRMRHTPASGFGSAQSEMYASLGVYGTGPKSLRWRPANIIDGKGGFGYKAWPLYNVFVLVDDEGKLTDVFRRFSLTKRQFQLRWPNDILPLTLASLQDSDVTTVAEFVHVVSKRSADSYDPKALSAARHKWSSNYFCSNDQVYIGDEEGFRSNPYIVPRNATIAGDPYGYSPAEQAFPALGGVNAMKKTTLKMGHKALDPPLLANDDGVLSGRVDQRPGRVTYGGLDNQGRKLVQEMQTTSNFQFAKELIADERTDINDSFLVTLFQILTDTPEMTAAEVYERIAEKAALFAPTMAALQEEDQGPQVDREITLLAENYQLPVIPPELIEAKGEYKLNYSNPMNKALHATEVSGFMRWQQMAVEAAQISQNPEPLDWINYDTAMPDIADKMDVRAAWVATQDEVDVKREDRQKQQEAAMAVQAAPAAASVMASMTKTKQGANAPAGR